VNARLGSGIWAISLVALLPASLLLWFVGGMGACGAEVYDTPPGSTGDQACAQLVEPVWPWATLATTPLALGLALGLLALRTGRRRLLVLATCLPLALVVLALLGAGALY
jgi:hypothetical protein